jgi:hypothetical protein
MKPSPRSAATRRRIGIVGAVFALTLAAPPLAGARDTHYVRVLDSSDHIIATFQSAKCVKNKNGFFATTPHPPGQKYLHVRIEDFTGFHKYELTMGGNADPYVVFAATDGTRYSNLNRPPFPSPGSGQVHFAKDGKLMGVGYSPAYSADGSDAVSFTGVLKCNYRKR